MDPPKIRFLTKIWHPNIDSETGAMCMLERGWGPFLTLKTTLLAILVMLGSPEPDDPQDAIVAKQYKTNHAEFIRTARHWTNAYARPQLEDEGF